MKLKDLIKERLELSIRGENEGSMNIDTGFGIIDEKTGGLKKGELVIIGGRPGMGKSTFAIQMSIQIAISSRKVLYSNLDNCREWLVDKFIAQLKEGEHDLKSDYPLSILQNCCNIFELEKVIEKDLPEVVFIDYVQLMTAGALDEDKDLDKVIIKLKQIALEKGITVIVLSQLNRSVEYRGGDRRPMLSDLRGSGVLEEVATRIFMLYRPEYYEITEDYEGNSTIGLMEIALLLNKFGDTRIFGFRVNDGFTKLDKWC